MWGPLAKYIYCRTKRLKGSGTADDDWYLKVYAAHSEKECYKLTRFVITTTQMVVAYTIYPSNAVRLYAAQNPRTKTTEQGCQTKETTLPNSIQLYPMIIYYPIEPECGCPCPER